MALAVPQNNPFASPRTRPGAIPFRFPKGANLESLVSELRDNCYRGQIVGPHGSGKSTLLAALVPAIEAQGIRAFSVALHDGQRHLPADILRCASNETQIMLVVDGYEQLSYCSRAKLRWHCWRQGCGLLATTHAKVAGLPVLISLAPTSELMRELLDKLLEGDSPELRRQAEISFRHHGGNLREVWFDLYDRHERQERDKSACRVLPHSAG